MYLQMPCRRSAGEGLVLSCFSWIFPTALSGEAVVEVLRAPWHQKRFASLAQFLVGGLPMLRSWVNQRTLRKWPFFGEHPWCALLLLRPAYGWKLNNISAAVSAKRTRKTCINTVNWAESWDRMKPFQLCDLPARLPLPHQPFSLALHWWICSHVAVDKIRCNIQAASDSQTNPRTFVYL